MTTAWPTQSAKPSQVLNSARTSGGPATVFDPVFPMTALSLSSIFSSFLYLGNSIKRYSYRSDYNRLYMPFSIIPDVAFSQLPLPKEWDFPPPGNTEKSPARAPSDKACIRWRMRKNSENECLRSFTAARFLYLFFLCTCHNNFCVATKSCLNCKYLLIACNCTVDVMYTRYVFSDGALGGNRWPRSTS